MTISAMMMISSRCELLRWARAAGADVGCAGPLAGSRGMGGWSLRSFHSSHGRFWSTVAARVVGPPGKGGGRSPDLDLP